MGGDNSSGGRHAPIVATFGEPLIRFSVDDGERWSSATHVAMHVGGAEANVAVALSSLGIATRLLSAVPNSVLGDRALSSLHAAGVDTSYVARVDDSRMGLYFVESVVPPRRPAVLYDRAHSAFSRLTALAPTALDGVDVLHVSGITSALGGHPQRLLGEVVRAAHDRGVRVSIDVNYRRLLWTPAAAAAAMRPLLSVADIVLCAERDARTLFELDGPEEKIVEALADTVAPRATIVAVPCAEPGVAVHSNGRTDRLDGFRARDIDRIGAGDAFTAGLLFGVLEGRSARTAAGLGLTLAALARTVRGDQARFGAAELRDAYANPDGGLIR